MNRSALYFAASCCLLAAACSKQPKSGEAQDEARLAGRPASSFPAADEDYFKEMDDGIPLSPAEIKGRNTWIVWAGGNDRLWDTLSRTSVGTLYFLKTLSSHPGLKFSRDNRWNYLGLVNEPCFKKASGPNAARMGLWLDERIAGPGCPPDPFENAAKYPGVPGKNKSVPTGS